MISFVFTHAAEKKFLKFEKNIQERVREKLVALKKHDHIDAVLKPLTNFEPATHRLRIGSYRIILQRLSHDDFLVLDIGHRADIYQ